MGLNTTLLAEEMYKVYQEIGVSLQIRDLWKLKRKIKGSKELIRSANSALNELGKGREFIGFLSKLNELETEFAALEENFQDKLMVFIIGDGNVGKSTLLNAFVGYEVAKTSFKPLTWKIDVYDPDQKGKVLVKYKNGERKSYHTEEAKTILAEEEFRTEIARKTYKEALKAVQGKVKTPAELDEYKKYFGEKYLYVSNVSEVRWPVKNNWILEKCLLVDTPGMNQYLNDKEQIGHITDYYHKADGIIWLLDGNTIASANPKAALEDLETNLRQVGGLRSNLIAVINKIDLIDKNGGMENVMRVIADARRIYKDKFEHIVGISSKLAYEGVRDGNPEILNKSGIHRLNEVMKEVFMSESQELKAQAKSSGSLKLRNIVIQETEEFLELMNKLIQKYDLIKSEYDPMKERLTKTLGAVMDNFIQVYLVKTRSLITAKVSELANGKNKQFILDEMYCINELEKNWNSMLEAQREYIIDEGYQWQEYSRISEYTHLKVANPLIKAEVQTNIALSQERLDNIRYFRPNIIPGLWGTVENLFGKAMFYFRKNSIIETIINEITTTCDTMLKNASEELESLVNRELITCQTILDISFQDVLMPYTNCVKAEKEMLSLITKIKDDKLAHTTITELLSAETIKKNI